jgi:hypothetical protein
LVARQKLLHGRLRSFNAVKRLVKTLLDEPLSKPFDGSRATQERLGDSLVRPIRPVGISLEQNLGASNLLTGPFQLLDNAVKLISFIIRQSHDVQLPHGSPPCATQNRRFDGFCQSDILDVTEH